MKKLLLSLLYLSLFTGIYAGERFNFNASWLLKVGNINGAESVKYDDGSWQQVTLPYAFNGKEAFAVSIHDLSDTVMWYRKHFTLEKGMNARHVFIEFEGARQAAEVYLNGHYLGLNENGVTAFGFDLTPYMKKKGDNVIAVKVDNSWRYREKATGSTFQWNDKNFNANYGGLSKNVWLHTTGDVYQTLPLYDNLRTIGTYIYTSDFDVAGHQATIHVESEVKNETKGQQTIGLEVEIIDLEGKTIARFKGRDMMVDADSTGVCKASESINGLHFWSWGYGYLYTVKTRLMISGKCVDEVSTRTGFRKTNFDNAIVKINDRAIQFKGFAQRSSNEWPAIGLSVPAWMSDYSNGLALEGNANLFRWMHITPWKQDVESFDRIGMMQSMQAGDAEKDANGRQWEQRKEVMRDAIIYNRNNPSIIFYECGNNEISDEHMAEMKTIRDQYDPNGGRAIGSRNMLESRVAEYGGEMLYVNKSAYKPMWQMEYCRDEGLRKYWDSYSYPFHPEGKGPLYRGELAPSYNHNQDQLAVENVVRWNEYWTERPGTGKRVNSGGAKIIFSDTNTHFRGEVNYRTSGDVDAMRIAKDSWYAHQAMWDGWVDTEKNHTYIIGHWNYTDTVVKPVYVVSTSDNVELLLNGKSLGKGERSNTFLFTFNNVKWQPGTLTAISRDSNGAEQSRYEIKTVDKPAALRLKWIAAPNTFRADGADVRIAEVEVVDKNGDRCPLANDMIHFSVNGPAEWLGGIALGNDHNYILDKSLPVECGVNRVMIKSTTKAGSITLKASATGFADVALPITSTYVPVKNGFYTDAQGKAVCADWGAELPCILKRGETPSTPSYTQKKHTIEIKYAEAASDSANVKAAFDDNEATSWKSDGMLENAHITFHLAKKAMVDEMVIKLVGFRSTSYPLEIYSGNTLVGKGYTPKGLGYTHFALKPTKSDTFTVKMVGETSVKEAFADMVELADKAKKQTKPSNNTKLQIMEVEFNGNEEPVPVIITAGQSNTDGRVLNTQLPEYIKTNKYKYCYWRYGSNDKELTNGFELFWPKMNNDREPNRWAYDAVTYYWLEQQLQKKFYVIKWSLGGTAIDTMYASTSHKYWFADKDWLRQNKSTWQGGASLLKSFTELIGNSIDTELSKLPEGYDIKAFLWHQGESDSHGHSPYYYRDLKNVIAYVRDYLVKKTGDKKYKELPFIFGSISHENKRFSPDVEKAMQRIAAEDKNCYLIDMSRAELQKDKMHFTAVSAEELGKKMYEELMNISK
jgi:hypothetical protein